MKPITYRSNYPQGVAIRGREAYYSLRSSIRRLRRHSPTHMDVLWYADSLGLGLIEVSVSYRKLDWGRVSAIGITGPVGYLP
jgi:hypothetical protein